MGETTNTQQGRRIPDGTFFTTMGTELMQPGDYGVEVVIRDGVEYRDWFVCLPDGTTSLLWVNMDDRNGNRHIVTEHDDGTITVEGSVLGSEPLDLPLLGSGKWHVYLRNGVWSRV